MVINMEAYYPQDRLQELWNNINSLHLIYLGMEESPKKMEQRNKLEECINDFLYMAPHDRKFFFRETAEVLHRSASNKVDFSGYKAVVAWNAIGRYAENLLSQPWRKEYRTIKTYSGFYKHQIDANLVGAEVMFEAMGYKHYRDGVLALEGPICPDRLTQVSQDSIVAYVECQILKSIWEQASTNFKVSWVDVLEIREAYLCGPKQAVQALNYRFHQRHYQEQRSFSQGSERFHGTARYPTAIHHNAPILSTNHSFPPLTNHLHMQAQSTPLCIYANNGYYSTYGPIPQHYPHCTVPFQYTHPSTKPQYPATNGFCYPNGYPSSATGYVYPPVPTAQLIELEHTYDVPDGHTIRRPSISQSVEMNKNKNENDYRINNNTDKEEGSGTFESWDYVYRNLESQGYSKDLGERGDILSLTKEKHPKETKYNIKSTDLEEALANFNLMERPLKVAENLKQNIKIKEPERRNSVITPSSSYDNLSGPETNVKKPTITNSHKFVTPPSTSKTLPREKLDYIKPTKASTSKTIDHRKSVKLNETEKLTKPKELKPKLNGNNNNNNNSNKWNCKACTYLNSANVEICEICSKSKTVVLQDMEVGGSECSHCTLVNPKELQACQACGKTLKDSPTYI